MLAYARKLTLAPSSVAEDDISQLQAHGYCDLAILEINLAVAYMNFVNRIAQGLGVELEQSLESFRR